QRQPSRSGSGSGMSPIMIALLGLLAYKALKGRGGQAADPGGTGRPPSVPSSGTDDPSTPGGGLGGVLGGLLRGRPSGVPSGAPTGGQPGGGLADMIPGGLGGLLGGAAAGSVLSGGLSNRSEERRVGKEG